MYKDASLSATQVEELMQKCSKHRARHAPPAASPKLIWDVRMEDDEGDVTLPAPSPLKTREFRRQLRESRNK